MWKIKNEDFKPHLSKDLEELENIFSSLEDENLYEDGELDEVAAQKKFRSIILRMASIYLKMGYFLSPEDVELHRYGHTPMGMKVKVLQEKIEDLEEKLNRSFTWDVEDFEMRAANHEEWSNVEKGSIYDYSKMGEALKMMIHKHDASIGSPLFTKYVVDFWLDEVCRKKGSTVVKPTSDCPNT